MLPDPGSLSAAVNVGLSESAGEHHYGNWLGDDDLLTLDSLDAKTAMTDIQVCQVCGCTLEGEAPEKCPICGAPKKMFHAVA